MLILSGMGHAKRRRKRPPVGTRCGTVLFISPLATFVVGKWSTIFLLTPKCHVKILMEEKEETKPCLSPSLSKRRFILENNNNNN